MFNPRTFPCPACGEIINDQMQVCKYCSAPVDREAAAAAAELQGKVNQACSDASYLRTAAVVMLGFLAASLIPFLGIAFWGFLVTLVAVLVMFVRWQANFGGLRTNDPDYAKARRSRNVALVLWLAAFPLGFVVRPLLLILVGSLFGE
ncbi:MAG TPA: zinc ribbon domain-containing protein [Pyrinomonadaceae bacterium]|nr:zinc ribbon domain-containing protein [Pyrinomonadaceae bacterium]